MGKFYIKFGEILHKIWGKFSSFGEYFGEISLSQSGNTVFILSFSVSRNPKQGCHMVLYKTKIHKFGFLKRLMVLQNYHNFFGFYLVFWQKGWFCKKNMVLWLKFGFLVKNLEKIYYLWKIKIESLLDLSGIWKPILFSTS